MSSWQALADEAARWRDEGRTAELLGHFRQQVPAYMVPREVVWVASPLPRNPNGKFDRQRWRDDARL